MYPNKRDVVSVFTHVVASEYIRVRVGDGVRGLLGVNLFTVTCPGTDQNKSPSRTREHMSKWWSQGTSREVTGSEVGQRYEVGLNLWILDLVIVDKWTQGQMTIDEPTFRISTV